jgi:3-oxoacyl-[acyl-carrier protein] reductase
MTRGASKVVAAGPRLADKTIIITGGAHGIGRSYCEAAAAQGASVGIIDVDGDAAAQVAAQIEATGGRAHASAADVSEFSQVGEAVSAIHDELGPVHGLVNNAGMLNVVPVSRALFEDIPEDEWDRMFAVNTRGTWNCCRAVVPLMRSAGGGSIVNIGSSTIFRANPTRAHYVASKAAILGFSRVLSRELGGDWIRVNTVCPGSTLSEENPTPEIVRMREEPIAFRSLKRVQVPQDMVGLIVYLLSDESAYLTGQNIVLEGGSVVY